MSLYPLEYYKVNVMNKETSNRLRFWIEDVLPAIARDSRFFRWAAALAFGENIVKFADFRKRIVYITDKEYSDIYKNTQDVHDNGDNTAASNATLIKNIIGESLCDVGCGKGGLLRAIQKARPDLKRLCGVDFAFNVAHNLPNIEFIESKIESLPFKDNEFDTVVCTHVIEHILEYRKAIAELRRITRKRLIIITPREREYYYTFNTHLNFFPYPHSLLRAMYPVPPHHECYDIKRDLYYQEDRPDSGESKTNLEIYNSESLSKT